MPFATSHHCQIYYEAHGDGPAVVLAHGRGGNAASWFQQVPAFPKAGYRVITFDHRCFGRSYCPPEHFDRAYFASDLAAVLDAAGVEKAAVVCQWSLATGIAIGLALVAATAPVAALLVPPAARSAHG